MTKSVPMALDEALASDDPQLQRSAVDELRANPTGEHLDRLWFVHKNMQTDPQKYLGPRGSSYHLYDESFGALRAGTRANPSWLEQAIANAPDGDEANSDLAYLVANLQDHGVLWNKCKKLLFAKIPATKARSLATNIGVYRDADELPWAVSHIGDETDHTSSRAFNAVLKIDPDLAIENLTRLSTQDLILSRKWNFVPLLIKRPIEADKAVKRLLSTANDVWPLIEIYEGMADELAPELVELVLQQLSTKLQNAANVLNDGENKFYHIFRLLASINKPELVALFRHHQAAQLEDLLVAFLKLTGARKGLWQDNLEREPALAILERIEGLGFVDVVNSYLRADSQYGVLDAIRLSVRASNEETVQLLSEVVDSDKLWDERHAVLQGIATEVLAELKSFPRVVASVQKWGLLTHRAVHAILDSAPRFDDDWIADQIIEIHNSHAPDVVPKPGAVLAAGLAKRHELTEKVIDLLVDSPRKSQLALECLVAIGELRTRSDRAVLAVAQQLEVAEHSYQAKQALIAIGTTTAQEQLIIDLEKNWDGVVVSALLDMHCSSQRFEAFLRSRLQNPETADFRATFDALMDSPLGDLVVNRILNDNTVVREALTNRASIESNEVWVVGSRVKAIRALSLLDHKKAFELATIAIKDRSTHDRELYPYLLMDLDGREAVDLLVQTSILDQRRLITWSIARSLEDTDLSESLVRLSVSDHAAERLAAARLAAWQRPERQLREALITLLDDEDEVRVAAAAVETLRAWSNRTTVESLVLEFNARDTSARRRWRLIDSMIHIGDPGDRHATWPKWRREIESLLTWYMQRYVEDNLKERQKKLRSDAEWQERSLDEDK